MTLVQEEPARIARNRDAIAAVIAALTAQFGNRLVTSQAVREQRCRLLRTYQRTREDLVDLDVEPRQALNDFLEFVDALFRQGSLGIVGPLVAALRSNRVANVRLAV
jgi:hypothetical protein